MQGDDGARVDAGHQRPGGEGEAGPEARGQRESLVKRCVCCSKCYCCACLCFIDAACRTVLRNHSISTSSLGSESIGPLAYPEFAVCSNGDFLVGSGNTRDRLLTSNLEWYFLLQQRAWIPFVWESSSMPRQLPFQMQSIPPAPGSCFSAEIRVFALVPHHLCTLQTSLVHRIRSKIAP